MFTLYILFPACKSPKSSSFLMCQCTGYTKRVTARGHVLHLSQSWNFHTGVYAVESLALEMNRDHSVILEVALKSCISDTLFILRSTQFLPWYSYLQVFDIMVIWILIDPYLYILVPRFPGSWCIFSLS